MAKGKDFYGQEVTTIIEEACREFGVSQEELDIEVLETGSAGIFGLCRKKAHIRAQKKASQSGSAKNKSRSAAPAAGEKKAAGSKKTARRPVKQKKKEPAGGREVQPAVAEKGKKKKTEQSAKGQTRAKSRSEKKNIPEKIEPPTEEVLVQAKNDICQLLELMGYPSTVTLKVEDTALRCHISGEHEEVLVGTEGRTIDSMQYLLRKMMSGSLPERMMLSLDAGDFRQRRAEELKARALQLAGEVKETGKTQAIPALNPAERREVHMVLQEDKAIRSRSVGDGLFKKILIYKPGKGNKSSSRKRRGRQSGRSSEN